MKAPRRWLVSCLILTLVLLATGCAGNKAARMKRSRSARDIGERYLQAGETTRALQQFLKALELYPDDPFLHYDLAYTYNLKGIQDKAEFHLKEAIRLKPDYSDAYNYLGVIYFNNGKVDLAIESYEKALSNILYLSPQNAHFNLGVAYLSREDYRKAVEHFQEATRIVPDYAAAYLNLGRSYEGLHMDRQAKHAYEKAVEFSPNSPQPYFSLGKFFVRTGEKRAAAESFKEVMRLAPDSDLAREAELLLKAIK